MQTELPTWVIWAVGISSIIQIFSGLVITGFIVFVLIRVKGNIFGIFQNLEDTTKNVEKISTDAANTTHNVTGAVNRVSNLVGSAASKVESPLIRAVGLASGVVAASRSMRGKKNRSR